MKGAIAMNPMILICLAVVVAIVVAVTFMMRKRGSRP
jgi:hypothetical protein